MSALILEHRHSVCVPNGHSARCSGVKRRWAHRLEAYVPACGETQMTNDESMTKHEVRKDLAADFRHLIIRHSFGLRHSSLVIVTL
jgi:hypothetical protein